MRGKYKQIKMSKACLEKEIELIMKEFDELVRNQIGETEDFDWSDRDDYQNVN